MKTVGNRTLMLTATMIKTTEKDGRTFISFMLPQTITVDGVVHKVYSHKGVPAEVKGDDGVIRERWVPGLSLEPVEKAPPVKQTKGEKPSKDDAAEQAKFFAMLKAAKAAGII